MINAHMILNGEIHCLSSCKRIYGKEFKNRIFLVSCLHYPCNAMFVVVEYASATLIAAGQTKVEALQNARVKIAELRADGGLARHFRAGCNQMRSHREMLAREVINFQEWKAGIKRRSVSIDPKRRKVFEAAGGICFYCKTKLEIAGEWHIEHKLPRSRGGTDHYSNLTAACVPCNYAKGTKTHTEFIEQRSA